MTQFKEDGGEEPSRSSAALRTGVWFGAAVMFIILSSLADWLAERNEQHEAHQQLRAHAQQLLIEEEAKTAIGKDCVNSPQCMERSIARVDQFLETAAGTSPAADTATAESGTPHGEAGTRFNPYDHWPLDKIFFLVQIFIWIAEALAALVMLEGVLRVAVWLGSQFRLIDGQRWEKFNDKLLDKIAELATDRASMSAVLPLIAAVTAAGSMVYVSSPSLSGKITLDAPRGAIPITVSLAPGSGTLPVNFAPASTPVKVKFVPASGVQAAMTLDALRFNIPKDPDIASMVHATEQINGSMAGMITSIAELEKIVLGQHAAQAASRDGYTHVALLDAKQCKEINRPFDHDHLPQFEAIFDKSPGLFPASMDLSAKVTLAKFICAYQSPQPSPRSTAAAAPDPRRGELAGP